jgi:hypothetical protein
MNIQKPQPLMVDGKAYYTLTSYDPVEIEVYVPSATDDDVEMMLDTLLRSAGAGREVLSDANWLKQHFGTDDLGDIREAVRTQVIDGSYESVDRQRQTLCAEALAERLGQSVPPAQLAEVRRSIETSLRAQIQASGMRLDDFLAQMGTTQVGLDSTLDEQARSVAEQDAALGAFAQARKLTVEEGDYPRLLHMPASQCQALVEQAKAIGQEEQIRDSALHNHALEVVVAECVTHYHYETPEEARERAAQMRAMGRRGGAAGNPGSGREPMAGGSPFGGPVAGGPASGAPAGRPQPRVNPNLKLV